MNSKAIHMLAVDQNVSSIRNVLETGLALGASVQILAQAHAVLKLPVLLQTIYPHAPVQKDIQGIHSSVVAQHHVRKCTILSVYY
jgi:hypothetical protein